MSLRSFSPNFIDDGTQLWLIDWEYACWGNVLFDLADLSSELDLDNNDINYLIETLFRTSMARTL